jgi:hypothetical protein
MNWELFSEESPQGGGREYQERGIIRGVVGSSVGVPRAACGSSRFSRVAQRVVMLCGGELTLSACEALKLS